MGEVYRARDARLNRDVAIKILPPLLAADPDRLARFEREARTIAALNHPHICAVYDVGDAPNPVPSLDPIHFLVMELVEGPTLAEKLHQPAVMSPQPSALSHSTGLAMPDRTRTLSRRCAASRSAKCRHFRCRSRPPEERVAAVEFLRRQFHGPGARLRRVHRLVDRAAR
jgi:hypothetical protein